eukprot:m.230150 g.230150  ORF g.230150 m.230150 type:complete len:133 (-) comp26454_c0_seq6:30-428(-)
MFKSLSTKLSICLFLGIEPDDPQFARISQLTTVHWRGVISLPVSLKIPGLKLANGFSAAQDAREELLEIIKTKLSENANQTATQAVGEVLDTETAAQHLLLFISALVPKAMASLLTFLVEKNSSNKRIRPPT